MAETIAEIYALLILAREALEGLDAAWGLGEHPQRQSDYQASLWAEARARREARDVLAIIRDIEGTG